MSLGFHLFLLVCFQPLQKKLQLLSFYIDAYTEPVLTDGWPPADWDETREEYAERLRNTPAHLCRLRYFGNDEWGFAFYTYSYEKYELSMYDDGQFTGKPERAFLISGNAYLNE